MRRLRSRPPGRSVRFLRAPGGRVVTPEPDTIAHVLDELLDAINACPNPAPGVWGRFGQVAGYAKELRQFLGTEAGTARFDDYIQAHLLAYLFSADPDQAQQALAEEFTAEVRAAYRRGPE